MYHFITKAEYFDALENTDIYNNHCKLENWGLKHCQDVCVLRHLLEMPVGAIAEVGGGISRTLPFLASKGWECWNIEPFERVGGGPAKTVQPGINNIETYLGEFSELLDGAQFDAVFSISVIEHVPNEALYDFFKDMQRILKPGALAWHAIDVYLYDEVDEYATMRRSLVLDAALKAGFKLIEIENMPEAKYHCSYATNPDLVMRQWNKAVPELKERRAISQVVSLMLGLQKT